MLTVEGEEDCALLDLHLDWRVAKTQFAGSKTAVLAAAERAERDGINWIAFVIDADFDRYNGKSSAWPAGVLATEFADLFVDATIASPEVISGVLLGHGAARARSVETALGSSLDRFCRETASYVGAIREAIVDGEFSITARGWNFSGIVLSSSNERDPLPAVVAEAVRRSSGTLSPDAVKDAVARRIAVPGEAHPRYLNGHDIVGVAAELARHISGRSVRRDSIAATCRVAFRCEGFVILQVVREVRAWAVTTHDIDPFRCTVAA
ncbi:MAG: hypothetical protein L6311_16220 [Cellulomonas sp.]|nr:hypothetical protein [Cellulomonas sp.]